jgi:hypothetical protein
MKETGGKESVVTQTPRNKVFQKNQEALTMWLASEHLR